MTRWQQKKGPWQYWLPFHKCLFLNREQNTNNRAKNMFKCAFKMASAFTRNARVVSDCLRYGEPPHNSAGGRKSFNPGLNIPEFELRSFMNFGVHPRKTLGWTGQTYVLKCLKLLLRFFFFFQLLYYRHNTAIIVWYVLLYNYRVRYQTDLSWVIKLDVNLSANS